MVKNPKIYQGKVWYFYASGCQESGADPGVFTCFVKDVSGEGEDTLFLIETENGKEGMISPDQLFCSRKDAEKYHQELLQKKFEKLREKLQTKKDLLLFALSKNTAVFCSDYEKEIVVMQRGRELGFFEED